MSLKDRKRKILEVIIKDYINFAEPVGSRTLSKRYNLGISPATIRNEMADLEDMGYLIQPHTSSGRIPTQKAYRFYVDEIMQIEKLTKVMRNDIHRGYLKVGSELDNTMQHTASLLSTLTNYTSIVMSPRVSHVNCKHVQIIPLIRDRVLIILVTREGIAKDIEMCLSKEIDANQALKLSNILNTVLKNAAFREIQDELIDQMAELSEEENTLLHEVVAVLRDTLAEDNTEVRSRGLTNLMSYPEFNDVEKIRHLVSVIEEKPLLASIFDEDAGNQILRITIGNENSNEDLKEFSIMTTTYELEGRIMGAFGIIGPTRMNYDKVSSVLNFIRDELRDNLTKLLE